MSDPLNLNEAALEILKATHDGDDLIPRDLKLVEDAVNGFLHKQEILIFKTLLETVRAGYFKSRSKTIAALNDELRTTFNSSKGQILATQGFMSLPINDQAKLFELVKTFNDFSNYNDPYHEHDMGSVEHNGQKAFWKIDYYNKSLTCGSEDPADPDVTSRVITIMLAHEWYGGNSLYNFSDLPK